MPTADPRTVRAATADDLAAVAGVYAYYVTETVLTFDEVPPTAAEWERRLDDCTARGLPFLVAEVAGEVVGYAYASPWKAKTAYRHTVENTVYLSRGHTGQGLGGLLLRELLASAAAGGFRRMIAVISDTGAAGGGASVALHRRHGFTPAGRLTAVGHKHGRWIDTVLLQRPLGESPGPTPR